MRCCLLVFISLLFHFLSIAQTPTHIHGSVNDAQTGKPLAFAYITLDKNVIAGSTDLAGKFDVVVHTTFEKISFLCAGYEPFVYEINAPEDTQPLQRLLQIPLMPKSAKLLEFSPNPQSPACLLIQKAVKNRTLHNHKNIPAYSYINYSKARAYLEDVENPTLPAQKDSAKYKMAKFLKSYDMFWAETVTRYERRAPAWQHEEILANKIAGLQEPNYLALSMQAQKVDFYEDYVSLLNRKYLNPLTPNAHKRYAFAIEDTIIVKPDTIFWIAFKPLPHHFFDGLQGRIAVHSRTFAIQSIDIESALREGEIGMGFRIQHQYEWVNKQYWFPKEVRTTLILRRVKLGNRRMLIEWHSHLSDIAFKKPTFKPFRDWALQAGKDTLSQEAVLAKYRYAPLKKRDHATIARLDTIGKADKLDRDWALLQHLLFFRVPIKRWKMDFDLRQAFYFNRYELARVGVALVTNDLFSKKYRLGANVNYGTRDGNFKYGFWAQYRPFKHIDASVTARYRSDVEEPARIRFGEGNVGLVLAPNRQFFTLRMDKIRAFDLRLQAKLLQNLRFETSFRSKRILPTYDYMFWQSEGVAYTHPHRYQLTEWNVQLQYYWGMQYAGLSDLRGQVNRTLPALYVSYTQGIRALDSPFRYGKWEIRALYEHNFRQVGLLHAEIWAGFSKGDIPYHTLWNGQGTGREIRAMIPNFFETMGMYEFLTDRFAYLFLRHNFRRLLYKSYNVWFQPEPVIYHSIGWGTLRNPSAHIGIETKSMDKTFWESGFMLNNVFKARIKKVVKIGAGGGVFYRYGAYHLPDMRKNWAYKLALTFGI